MPLHGLPGSYKVYPHTFTLFGGLDQSVALIVAIIEEIIPTNKKTDPIISVVSLCSENNLTEIIVLAPMINTVTPNIRNPIQKYLLILHTLFEPNPLITKVKINEEEET